MARPRSGFVARGVVVQRIVVPILLVGLMVALAGRASAESSALEAVCPVDWRGVSLREGLDELAGRLEVPYVLDSSVDAAGLARRVRMSASHLTGGQAFRWLVRSAGLAAVLVDGTFLIAAEERLPVVWRVTGAGGRDRRPVADDAGWARARGRRADIRWVDAPLSGVAKDISAAFGIDVIFHPTLLADQGLVYFEASQSRFDRVCQVLAEQLGAQVRLVDGAVWVCPAAAGSSRLPAPAPTSGAGRVAARESAAGPLDRVVKVDRSVGGWPAFAARLAAAGGLAYRIEVPPGASYPTMGATGSVAGVLEAARLLGRLSWSFPQASSGQAPTLKIRVHEQGQPSGKKFAD